MADFIGEPYYPPGGPSRFVPWTRITSSKFSVLKRAFVSWFNITGDTVFLHHITSFKCKHFGWDDNAIAPRWILSYSSHCHEMDCFQIFLWENLDSPDTFRLFEVYLMKSRCVETPIENWRFFASLCKDTLCNPVQKFPG